MRLDKMLSDMKIATRKEIKAMVKKGIVSVNSVTATKSSQQIDENNDVVRIYDEIIEYRKYLYFVMNKRKGVTSNSTDYEHETVIDDMGELCVFDLKPVGRLDKDTTGLLIITNDGKFAHNLISPKKDVSKKYLVTLKNKVDKKYNDTFEKGIKLMPEDIVTKPATMEIIDDYNCYLTIKEGKFHQVKRMFEKVGNEVVELKRVQIGDFKLPEELEEGDYRELTDEEMKILGLEIE
ncbi:pseudouridine synthase [uncultured Finegoldia sp.]|uniref:pseudouridine synthase n=1 Tax=uncultured Finegoldia sp. TaxID=328009 RepID=UPI0026231790|nr:pseudouridine synthase [uncultured Finegoldia sp.]